MRWSSTSRRRWWSRLWSSDIGNRRCRRPIVCGCRSTKADPRWQEAIRARGIEDLAQVQMDPWPTGDFVAAGPGAAPGRVSFRVRAGSNGYARPIEASSPSSTSTAREVVEVEDHGVVPCPSSDGNYDVPAAAAGFRAGPRAARDHAARGAELRRRRPPRDAGRTGTSGCRLHPVEGLVLHQVGYRDGGEVRSILYRASLAEMVVPYGDPEPALLWRNAFDAGEVGLGTLRQRTGARAATAWARSATSTPVGVDQPRRAVLHRQRDLHARGGLWRPLEAHGHPHRRRPRCAGRGGWSSAPSTRSGTTSTAASGTSTRTARSSSR